MSSQLSLFAGEPPASRQRSSLFIAVVPDEAAIRRILENRERISHRHGHLGNLVRPELLHITLAWVSDYQGELPPRVVRDCGDACAAAAAKSVVFPIQLDQIGTYQGKPGARPLVMKGSMDRSARLVEFRKTLMDQLALRGIRCKGSTKFDPHLTLSRGSLELAEDAEAVGWLAGEVVLLRSLLGLSRYVPLGCWKFGPEEQNPSASP
jgi:2'-5' RNA ligase